MKKILIIAVTCLVLQGCTFYKHTVMTADGDKLSVPIAGLLKAKGEKVELELNRVVCVGKCNAAMK